MGEGENGMESILEMLVGMFVRCGSFCGACLQAREGGVGVGLGGAVPGSSLPRLLPRPSWGLPGPGAPGHSICPQGARWQGCCRKR